MSSTDLDYRMHTLTVLDKDIFLQITFIITCEATCQNEYFTISFL